jgi:hypothetical protein
MFCPLHAAIWANVDVKAERPRVYFDLEIGGIKQGRVVFELVCFKSVNMAYVSLTVRYSTVMVRSCTCRNTPRSSDNGDSCPEDRGELSGALHRREGHRKAGQTSELQRCAWILPKLAYRALIRTGRVNLPSSHQVLHDPRRRLYSLQRHWRGVDIRRKIR